jgi:hypothetical protein
MAFGLLRNQVRSPAFRRNRTRCSSEFRPKAGLQTQSGCHWAGAARLADAEVIAAQLQQPSFHRLAATT